MLLGVSALTQPVRMNLLEESVRSEREMFQVATSPEMILLHRAFYGQEGLMIDYLPVPLPPARSGENRTHGLIQAGQHMTLLNTALDGRRFHFLTRDNQTRELHLFTVSPDSGAYRVRIFRNALMANSIFFKVSSRFALSAGYIQSRPVAMYLDFRDGTARVLPGSFNRNGEVNDLKLHSDATFELLLASHFPHGKSMVLQRYSADGQLVRSSVIRPEGSRQLIFGRMSALGDDSVLVAGTYGRGPENSRGIFTALVTPDQQYILRFYNYADLRNYFGFLPDRKERRIRQRIARRREKGRPLRFPTRMLVHELTPDGNVIHLLGEAIQPVFRNGQSVIFRPVNTGPYAFIKPYYAQQRDMVFDGFRYTHAVSLTLKRDGTLKRDHAIELKNIRTFTLRSFTVHQALGDSVHLSYPTPEAVVIQSFLDSQDDLKNTSLSRGREWEQISQLLTGPGGRLLVAGIREHRSAGAADDGRRRYFFLDEIRF